MLGSFLRPKQHRDRLALNLGRSLHQRRLLHWLEYPHEQIFAQILMLHLPPLELHHHLHLQESRF